MEKKDYIIIILSLVIVILITVFIWFIFSGNSGAKSIIDKIQGEFNELVRSTAIIESELDRSIGANTQLEADNSELRNDNTELEQIIANLTSGSQKTKDYLAEYGVINTDFGNFIQENRVAE